MTRRVGAGIVPEPAPRTVFEALGVAQAVRRELDVVNGRLTAFVHHVNDANDRARLAAEHHRADVSVMLRKLELRLASVEGVLRRASKPKRRRKKPAGSRKR